VYSHSHIVRLRVSRGAAVLADIGGPYILAPVRGALSLGGKQVGTYLMSVQDDLGLQLLIGRYTGMPVVMRIGSRQVMGNLNPGPASIPDRGFVGYRSITYYAYTFSATAFPRGLLRVSVLVPSTAASSPTQTCAQVRASELADVALHVSRRFAPLNGAHYGVFVGLARAVTGALILLRSGSQQLAGNPSDLGTLPSSGSAYSYGGQSYLVYSFAPPTAPSDIRVYVLLAGV
jgi:hypothetical protein